MNRVLVRSTIVFGSVIALLIGGLPGGTGTTAVASDKGTDTHQASSLTKKEKQQLVEEGVASYEAGNKTEAREMLEKAEAVYPENYMVPYYLGLIYLEKDRLSDAIAQWQRYVAMDEKSENSIKTRKYLTLLLRRQAEAYARQAVADEDALMTAGVQEQTVAVTPFQNLGTAKLDPLGKGMAAMLISDLSQVPDLQVIERVKLQVLMDEMKLGASGIVDPRNASKMGHMLKASHVTAGSLAEAGQEKMQIASVLMDTQARRKVAAPEASGAIDQFFALEKQIATGIVKNLGRDPERMPKAFNKVHTRSMPAMIAYSEGLDAMDRERYDEARAKFQQALDEDPDFDLAEKALLATPLTMMVGMTVAQIVSGASSGGLPSAAAGSAVAGGAGISTTTAIVAGAAAAGGAAALAGGGGGGGGDGGTDNVDISGDWRGTWNDGSGGSGAINLNLSQSGTSVGGSATVTGSDCLSSGDVSGSVAGDQARLTIVSGTEQAALALTYQDSGLYGILTYGSGNCSEATVSLNLTGGAIIRW